VRLVTLTLAPGTAWQTVYARARAAAPDAFDEDGRLLNLYDGAWHRTGTSSSAVSPVDECTISGVPRLDREDATAALAGAVKQHQAWGRVPLAERQDRVAAAVASMREHRDTLALLLVWEIGKPWRLACADVDRCLDGVDWYLGEIERQLGERTPLPGPVSNIASWNYPMSVLVHAMLVQLLAGNAVLAKTPTDGGAACLTLASALMHDAGLPVTLVSGYGSRLSSVLVSNPDIGALAFVGGRSAGGPVAAGRVDPR
jgi:acyl-CoA reductase-like NAD-dependent aldehyde dehydrogenase